MLHICPILQRKWERCPPACLPDTLLPFLLSHVDHIRRDPIKAWKEDSHGLQWWWEHMKKKKRKCEKMWETWENVRNPEKCEKPWENVRTSEKMWENMRNPEKMWENLWKYEKSWENVRKPEKIWETLREKRMRTEKDWKSASLCRPIVDSGLL